MIKNISSLTLIQDFPLELLCYYNYFKACLKFYYDHFIKCMQPILRNFKKNIEFFIPPLLKYSLYVNIFALGYFCSLGIYFMHKSISMPSKKIVNFCAIHKHKKHD